MSSWCSTSEVEHKESKPWAVLVFNVALLQVVFNDTCHMTQDRWQMSRHAASRSWDWQREEEKHEVYRTMNMLQVFASRVSYAWHHTSHHLRGHAFNIVHSSSLLLTSRYTSRVRLAQVKTRPRCPCVCVSVSVSVLVKRLTRTCKREVGSNVFGRARIVFGMPPICL